jgi:hypothetical protein
MQIAIPTLLSCVSCSVAWPLDLKFRELLLAGEHILEPLPLLVHKPQGFVPRVAVAVGQRGMSTSSFVSSLTRSVSPTARRRVSDRKAAPDQ